MAARQPHFSPKQVAEALGSSESSVKRWCDRGEIRTIRTVGGHRRITLEGVHGFLQKTDRQLLKPEYLGIPSPARTFRQVIPGSEEPGHRSFREALVTGDEDQCRQILNARIDANWTRSEAAEDLIRDAMHGIGSAWNDHSIDIYQERRSCGICMRLIGELRSQLPGPAAHAPIAIGGAPEGDPYQLPTALVGLALHEAGWNATNLGENLPWESFAKAAVDCEARLLWLSVSVIENSEKFISDENNLADSLEETVALMVGGRALTDSIRPRLNYTAHCDNLRSLTSLAILMRMA